MTTALVPAWELFMTRHGWQVRRFRPADRWTASDPRWCPPAARPDDHITWTGGGWGPAGRLGPWTVGIVATGTLCVHTGEFAPPAQGELW